MVSGQVSKLMGARVKRKEDPRLITGEGRYTDDVILPGMVYMAVLRSPHAHARIRRIDVSQAKANPQVLAVVTGRDLRELWKAPLPVFGPLDDMVWVDRYPMAVEKANFAGEIVAAVVATSRYAARDALELVQVDYEPLPAVVDIEKAAQKGSPVIHDKLGTNVAYESKGSHGNPDRAFRDADGVVKARFEQPRLIPNAMEPRSAVADYTRSTDELTLWSTTQNPHIERKVVASVLGHPESRLRVIAVDVGGGFGSKINTYPEPIIACVLAKQLGRPVKWTEDRQENFLSTSHGRGQVQYAEAAYKKDGTLLGLRLRVYADLGAYCQALSHAIPTLTPSLAPGIYRFQDMEWTTIGVYTNKTPYDAYRGAGRPEGAYIIERVMNLIAQELKMDPAEVRRRNFIPKNAFPYKTPTGMVYDSGDYEAALNKVLQLANYKKLREEQARLRQQGVLMGIGLATCTEVCGFGKAGDLPELGGFESATVRVDPQGKVTVFTGSSPHGQGEETSFAQIVAEELQIPIDDVQVVHGDTAQVPRGVGTFGSRTLVVGGTAALQGAQRVKEKAKLIASHLLKVPVQNVVYEGGRFSALDIPDRQVTWAEVARQAYDGRQLPDDFELGLEAVSFWQPPEKTFPFSAHIATVIIDKDTGQVKLTGYYAVDDCGVVINPLLVEGQVHGGIAQGVGQALVEEAVYGDNGQLLTGTFMDYAMPFADEFPMFTLDRTVTPSPLNPLGAKGIGEMATIAATPTVVNAVVDALSHLGVKHVDIPLKAEKIWRILKEKGVAK